MGNRHSLDEPLELGRLLGRRLVLAATGCPAFTHMGSAGEVNERHAPRR
jgi:hypothetical protein